MTIAISLYSFGTEKSYTEFPVTAEGLRDAQELLATPMAHGHRYGLAPWQFEDGHSDVLTAYRLVREGDVSGLAAFVRAHAPQI